MVEASKTLVLDEVAKIEAELKAAGVRVKCDAREKLRPGFKYSEWEMKGVPLRIEVGPRDIEKGHVVVARRIDRRKDFIQRDELAAYLPKALDEFQNDLLERARARVAEQTTEASTFDELAEIIATKRGFVWAGWDGSPETEKEVKEKTKATIRNIPFDGGQPPEGMVDIVSGKPAKYRVLFSRAY